MSDELKILYSRAARPQHYFDRAVPKDLFRGQSKTEARKGLPVLYPNPGFTRRDGSVRMPDVKVVERDGRAIVLGCRCITGDHRGISTFDRKNTNLGGFGWYRLPQGTPIPTGLAVTQDSDFSDRANHFTVAPKDDMPLELFQVLLNELATHAKDD